MKIIVVRAECDMWWCCYQAVSADHQVCPTALIVVRESWAGWGQTHAYTHHCQPPADNRKICLETLPAYSHNSVMTSYSALILIMMSWYKMWVSRVATVARCLTMTKTGVSDSCAPHPRTLFIPRTEHTAQARTLHSDVILSREQCCLTGPRRVLMVESVILLSWDWSVSGEQCQSAESDMTQWSPPAQAWLRIQWELTMVTVLPTAPAPTEWCPSPRCRRPGPAQVEPCPRWCAAPAPGHRRWWATRRARRSSSGWTPTDGVVRRLWRRRR